MTDSPAGRFARRAPNIQSVPIRTEEIAKVRAAYLKNFDVPELPGLDDLVQAKLDEMRAAFAAGVDEVILIADGREIGRVKR